MNNNLDPRVRRLIEKLVDETITKEESVQLEQILLDDPAARREYMKAAQFESSLHFYSELYSVEQNAGSNDQPLIAPSANTFAMPGMFTGFLSALAIALCLASVIYWQLNEQKTQYPVEHLSLVSYVGPEGAQRNWEDLSGTVKLKEGLLTVRTQGGSLISLEGPCEFEMTESDTGNLLNGKLVAFCGEDTDKLTINTSTGSYVDLGTEFGVSVGETGSSLHVFDGQVIAKEARGTNSRVVEGASSIESGKEGMRNMRLVDFAGFTRLRSTLSPGVVNEGFERQALIVEPDLPVGPWGMNRSRMVRGSKATTVENRPFGNGLQNCLSVTGRSKPAESGDDKKNWPFLELQWDYTIDQSVDTTKAHTIECLVRFDCDIADIYDFTIYGSEEATWKDRTWSVSARRFTDQLMWSVYNSPMARGSLKYQQLGIERGIPFHVLVEIDPEIGKFRTTVSDGQQSIWNELYDGSQVSLKSGPLGKLFWRIRAMHDTEFSFSIDSIQVRNRPVFDNTVSAQ